MKKLVQQLEDVFGGGGQISPGGTGAVLVRPSQLSLDIAEQVVEEMPLKEVCWDIGAVVARIVADNLEAQRLRAADYADTPDLSKVMARRIVDKLMKSEAYSQSFSEHLAKRG
jgi:hypothetical protein